MTREESTNQTIDTVTKCLKMKSDAGIDMGNDAEMAMILSDIALSLAKIADKLEEINDSL